MVKLENNKCYKLISNLHKDYMDYVKVRGIDEYEINIEQITINPDKNKLEIYHYINIPNEWYCKIEEIPESEYDLMLIKYYEQEINELKNKNYDRSN